MLYVLNSFAQCIIKEYYCEKIILNQLPLKKTLSNSNYKFGLLLVIRTTFADRVL